MAEIRNSTDGGTNPAYTLGDGEVAYLDYGLQLRSEVEAVDMSFGSNQVFDVNGLLDGSDGIFEDGTDNTIVNLVKGNIYGENYGIEVGGSYAHVNNFGIIDGYLAGESVIGQNIILYNSGEIVSSTLGVQLNAFTCTLTNDGAISGTVSGIDVISSSTTGNAIETIYNSGTIQGGTTSLSEELDAGDTLKLTNSGTLSGSVLLGQGTDTVRNSGTIVGDVRLDGGNDRFDGRGGTVSGEIFGGAGNDVIYNGADGGYVLGEAGHDTLFANTGADIFEFYSQSSLDWDTIHGFDVKRDEIQLDALDFSGLVAGQVPAFVVATKASRTSDHLFYNASTGGLYYDQDGSATADRPDLIAKMDKGLAMTASDFKIV